MGRGCGAEKEIKIAGKIEQEKLNFSVSVVYCVIVKELNTYTPAYLDIRVRRVWVYKER